MLARSLDEQRIAQAKSINLRTLHFLTVLSSPGWSASRRGRPNNCLLRVGVVKWVFVVSNDASFGDPIFRLLTSGSNRWNPKRVGHKTSYSNPGSRTVWTRVMQPVYRVAV